MGSHQFDKHIKDKLQFHKMEVPGGMWEKIEAGLPQKNKNRGIPFIGITTLSAALFLFIFSAYYITNYSNYALILRKEKQGYIHKPVQRKHVIADNVNDSERKPLSSGRLTAAPIIAMRTLEPSNLSSGNNNLTSSKLSSERLSENVISHSDRRNNLENESAVSRQATDMHQNPQISNAVEISDIAMLESKKFFIQEKNAVKRSLPKDGCLENFDKSGRGIFADIYYSNDLPIRSLKAKNSDFNKLAQSRAESETPLYSFSLGARLGFNINKNVNLQTGIHYSRINEKFEFVDPESSQTKVVKTTLYIKDGQGNIKDSTFTFDTIFIPGTLVYKIRNQYTSLDIPFLVGYRFLHKDKMSVTLNAGIMANLLFRQEGMALMNDQYTVKSFNNGDENNFHHSLGLSTFASAQFLYTLIPDFHLFLEPSIRFQHRDMTTKDYPISQNYTTISFLTGARYNF